MSHKLGWSFRLFVSGKHKNWKRSFLLQVFDHVIIPFADQCRQQIPDQDQELSLYLVADGEERQMKPIESDNLCGMLENAEITLVKGPASCRGSVGNACDHSDCVKATKAR